MLLLFRFVEYREVHHQIVDDAQNYAEDPQHVLDELGVVSIPRLASFL